MIGAYFDKINPLDKAGAYAAQEDGGDIIESVEGSFSNVVGLPLERTVEALSTFGIERVKAYSRAIPPALGSPSSAGRAAKRGKGTRR